METVKIESKWNKQTFIRLGKIKWEMTMKKFKKQVKYNFIAAGILLVLGFIVKYDEGTLNPFIIIGFVLLTISLFSALMLWGLKRNYLNVLKSISTKYDALQMDSMFEFTEENVQYRDQEKFYDLKWNAFSTYTTYKNVLLISTQDSLLNGIIIEKTDSDSHEFDKIYELAKTKLKNKEIT